jgi:hypothetical protein
MARCQACQGLGRIEMVAHLSPYSAVIYREPVCRACGGSGLEHCCEGIREQPIRGASNDDGSSRTAGTDRS